MIGKIVNEYPDDLRAYNFEWLLRCVEPQPLLKMFLAFKHSWWEKVWQRAEEHGDKPQGFKVFTNLPLRQIFYHFSQSRSRAEVARHVTPVVGDGEGMIMAYCDAKHASYWDALAFQDRKRYTADDLETAIRKLEQSDEGRDSAKHRAMLADLAEFGVSRHLAERAHEQIWRVHRGLVKSIDLPPDVREVSDFSRDETGKQEEIARSQTVLFMNWMRPPFYGGWHAWRIGVVSDDVKTIWEKPWLEANIYFAGEVMSSDQGWSEGALRSVERVLMRQLDVPAPHWIIKSGAREGVEVVDIDKKAQELGFEGIEDYVSW